MNPTITYSGTLVVRTCWCGIRHAVPEELDEQIREKGKSAYCPLGHSYVAKGESEVAKYRRLYDEQRDKATAIRAELDGEKASHRATKGHLTRTRKRIGNGVCPHCNRHFTNVERHMASKHPAVR